MESCCASAKMATDLFLSLPHSSSLVLSLPLSVTVSPCLSPSLCFVFVFVCVFQRNKDALKKKTYYSVLCLARELFKKLMVFLILLATVL